VRAVLYESWGGPEVLKVADLARPTPKDGEVLVRMAASSINSWDCDMLTGKPYIVRPPGFATGPKPLGFDVSGVVEAVGPNATKFRAGDAVFGDMAFDGAGAFAEYVAVKETALARKPEAISFEQAAALPQAGLLAALGLSGSPAITKGSRVLINGGGGGVGPLAIQLAKLDGAHVTGVDSAAKLETMRTAGADRVIDYAETDFTRTGDRYDRILDVTANRPVMSFVRALAPGGRLAVVGGTAGMLVKIITLGTLAGLVTGRRLGLVLHKVRAGELDRLGALCAAGKLMPVIDSSFPLTRVRQAFERFVSGQFTGKVMIRIDDSLP
jgi:NADPH:quinone reductase-like Zn-dependent oxidoreductase